MWGSGRRVSCAFGHRQPPLPPQRAPGWGQSRVWLSRLSPRMAGAGREPWHHLPACSRLPKVHFLSLITEVMSEVCQELSWNGGFSDTSSKIFLQSFESPFFPLSPCSRPWQEAAFPAAFAGHSAPWSVLPVPAAGAQPAVLLFGTFGSRDALELLSGAWLGVMVILTGHNGAQRCRHSGDMMDQQLQA